MSKRKEERECRICYNEDFKEAIEKRVQKEADQVEEEIVGLLKRKILLLKCPKCGNEQPPSYRGYFERCNECNHLWSLVKGFENFQNEKG